LQDELRRQTIALAHALKVVGLMNLQFAIQTHNGVDKVYVLEVNPRASRTVPFVSKAISLPLAKIAARCMAGRSLKEQGATKEITPPYFSVKEAVFPFIKFPGVDTILGPEMKSTGEVMGVGVTFGEAFVKSQMGAGIKLPKSGKAFLSVRNADKVKAEEIAKSLVALGFSIVATKGTAAHLAKAGIDVTPVNKVLEGRPHIVDMVKNREIALIINTVEEDKRSIRDSWAIRNAALQGRITYYTTVSGARAACMGMQHMDELNVYDLQSLHKQISTA
jgi:carbamoyl-phosphate synthase large subunit